MNRKAALAFLFAAISIPSTLLASEGPYRFGQFLQETALPPTSFPEGVVVSGGTTYVSGPAAFGTAGQGPSTIFAIDTASGNLRTTIALAGEDLTQEHALSCITTDAAGDLYVLSTQLGVVRVDPNTGEQAVYATVPTLPTCNAFPPGPCAPGGDTCSFPPGPCAPGDSSCVVPVGQCASGVCFPPGPCTPGLAGGSCTGFPPGPCAPVGVQRGGLVNDLAFDREGNLYITDSFQATIFRVTPGGGTAEPYYQDPRFDTSFIPGFSLGLNGLRVSPEDTELVFDVTFGPNAGVYTLPIYAEPPPPYTLQLMHAYTNGELPDGLSFGATEFGNGVRLYVALPGTSQIGLLDHYGREFSRLSTPSGALAPVTPFDEPANIAFDGNGSLLVTNHALFGNPADMALINVWSGDVGAPLFQPVIP